MKKVSEPFPTGKYDNSEVSRRLYRGAVEAARRLEDHLRNSLQQDIFGPEVTSFRMRLKDYCERLMFSDPSEYGRKAEELMWRKVYYDLLQLHKQQKKKNQMAQTDSELQNCLMAGIGNYHHLLLRLQAEFHLDLEGKVEVPFLWKQKGLKKERWKKHRRSIEAEKEFTIWAEQMCHRFLICLGDLSRYLCDAGDMESRLLSERYYRQAFCFIPSVGMPLNQLATLSGMKNHGCDALYYYMRCLLSPQPFEGVEGNILRLFEKNNETFGQVDVSEDEVQITEIGKRFSSRFLKLCEHFFLQKDENLQLLCQDVLRDFDICLTLDCKDLPSFDKTDDAEIVDRVVVFKVIVVALSFFSRLQEQGSPIVSAAAAFTLTLLSHVVRHCFKGLCQNFFGKQLETQPILPLTLNHTDIEDEPGTRSTSGTVTPTITNSTPQLNLEINDRNMNNEINKETSGNVIQTVTKKNKSSKNAMAHRFRKARRRRNCSITSQEDSEVSEGEQPEGSSDLDEDEEDDKWSSDEHGRINSDISETGSCSSCNDDEDDEDEDEEKDSDNTEQDENFIPNTKMEDCKSTLNCIGKSKNELENRVPSSTGSVVNTQNSTPTHATQQAPLINDGYLPQRFDMEDIEATPQDVYGSMAKEGLLTVIKVLSDWLRTNADIISACAEISKPLWCRFVDLLNLLLKTEAKLLLVREPQLSRLQALQRKKIPSKAIWSQPFYLPEDLELQKLPPLAKAHDAICDEKIFPRSSSKIEQVFVRIQCLLHFGFVLTDCAKTGVHFNFEKNKFELSAKKRPTTNPSTPTRNAVNGAATPDSTDGLTSGDIENQRRQLMRNMAHLWLKSEVSDLEVETRRSGSPHLSPYVVPDTGALCYRLTALKQLEASKRFILILPTIVISNLDFLKRESVGARDAIRWIETELRRGSRFLRAQKPHERLSLVPIKYPKKKDKEAWDFFQILECCNYLCKQNSSAGRDNGCPLVTLVTGGNQMLPSNALGVASSAGISMELVEEFTSKWRTSSKSQG